MKQDKIIWFHVVKNGKDPVRSALNDAKREKYKTVLIVGETEDGNIETVASTDSTMHLNWMLDYAKKNILEPPEED